MSSHLSVSYQSNAAPSATKTLNGSANDDASGGNGVLGLFAALLGGDKPATPTDTSGATTDVTQATQASQTNLDINLGDLIRIKLGAGSGDNADDKTDAADTGDANAATIGVDPSTVVVPQALANLPTAAQQPVADLIASLSELNTALTKGQTPSADLVAKLNTQIDAVNQALGLGDQSQPSFAALVAQANASLPTDAGTDQQLTQKLADLALSLTPSSAPADAVAAVSPEQTKLADKLATLAKALGNGAIPQQTLEKLGLDTTAPTIDPALKNAIAALAQTTSTSAPVTADTQPALASPSLSVTETSITGKAGAASTAADAFTSATTDTSTSSATQATATVTPNAAKAVSSSADDSKASDGKDKDKKTDAKTIATAIAGKIETRDAATATAAGSHVTINAATRPDAAATARPAATVYQTNQQQVNVPQIAFEMVRQAQHGNSKFQIRLDPPELGRIDVQLDIDNTTGTINARMMVEKSETLDLMQRDRSSLQQALQQAGIDSSKTNLEFSLRQNNSGQQGQQQGQSGGSGVPVFGSDTAEDTIVPSVNLYRGNLSASGVNIIA